MDFFRCPRLFHNAAGCQPVDPDAVVLGGIGQCHAVREGLAGEAVRIELVFLPGNRLFWRGGHSAKPSSSINASWRKSSRKCIGSETYVYQAFEG
jgi:hypothetical protein